MTNTEKLAQLNTFRASAGLAPLASWKNGRCQPMLDQYVADAEAARLAAEIAAQVEAYNAAAAKAAKPAKKTTPAEKPLTKKARVLDLLTAKGGTTIAAIAASLAISETAARSLIGDLRRDGAKITTAKGEGNTVTYHA